MSMAGHILVVDDDEAIRLVVSQALKRHGHRVEQAESIAGLWAALEAGAPDALISDVMLPDGNGLDALAAVRARFPELPVIILSAQNTLTTAVRAAERGAFEYLPKPFDLDDLARAVAEAIARRPHGEEEATLDDEALPLIGRSAAMQDVYRTIARVVSNELTVLITGESGTGKELVARAIHDLGTRRAKPFVAINMAAIPRELIEAELFGHERGAFTGATQRTAGRFEQAAGGTLFLDEIGDMPMDAQTRLLRVLQSGEFTTVGGARPIRSDVRIVAATNRDLESLVGEGAFREDLFYRLNVVPIAIPSLRQRRDDIGLLARHFLDRAAQEGLPRKRLDPTAVARLERQNWPGNVRELENMMRRAAALVRDETITAEGLARLSAAPGGGGEGPVVSIDAAVRAWIAEQPIVDEDMLHGRLLALAERPLIEAVLARTRGNQLRAARMLGINRNTLKKKIDDLGVAARPVSERD
ncbi:nitrogen regulation protein NR(I) [Sphingomonas gilva]|uniref:DNA-binding transcriptional regulator NtrC n=1 Tax=Sphingomonas gilva TaxID=2305907 RepID=A0A396RKD9_9SPHN|nr:nitrogen regulation protein NR(I) [Sphingomonas gilva]RHW16519.1 nitrogen regulation protein NR(I) [Sphingomonas gilva]